MICGTGHDLQCLGRCCPVSPQPRSGNLVQIGARIVHKTATSARGDQTSPEATPARKASDWCLRIQDRCTQ